MRNIQIKTTVLSVDECLSSVKDDQAGGIALFVGTVRNQTQGKKVMNLQFEAYEAMAIKELDKIAHELEKQWKVLHLAIHHRTGTLSVGDIPVVIAVSCPHRASAFEACQYAIDTLKETVPIWKKEIFEDGEVWVAAHP